MGDSEYYIVKALNDDVWRMMQISTIGGSNAAAVVGKSRFKTARELYDRMCAVIHRNETPPVPRDPGGDLKRGKLLESIAREQLAEHFQISIHAHDQKEFIYRTDAPWAHCLPDGWVGDDIVEIKCPRPGTVARVNMRGIFDEWVLQAQHNMHVCRAYRPRCAKCYLAIFDAITCNVFVYPIDYSEATATELMNSEKTFYESVLQQSLPEKAEELADDLDPDVLIVSDERACELTRNWLRLKEIKDDLDETLDSIKEELTAMIGDKSGALVSNIARIRYRYSKPSRYLNKSVVIAKYPSISEDEECWKQSAPARPFVVTPIKEYSNG